MEAKFKELTFINDHEWKKFLKETTWKVITFKDHGQELLQINVADTGEIIDCNRQSSIWNGIFVNMKKLNPDMPIKFWYESNGGKWKSKSFIIDNVSIIN